MRKSWKSIKNGENRQKMVLLPSKMVLPPSKMVLPQAMAWVQYWFRVLSLKFCRKSKKNCGDISQVSPAFCMYAFDYRSGLSWALKVNLCILDYEERTIIVFLIFKLIANGPFQSACEYVGMLGDGTGQHWPFSAWQYLAMVEHWPFSTPGICPTRHSVTRLTNHSLRE